jgi:hypothetical protein
MLRTKPCELERGAHGATQAIASDLLGLILRECIEGSDQLRFHRLIAFVA